LFQRISVPAAPFVAWLRTGAGRRTFGLALTLSIEALLLLLLLALGSAKRTEVENARRAMTTINVHEVPEAAPEPPRPEPEHQAAARPEAQRPQPEQPPPPQPTAPAVPPAVPAAPAIIPMRWSLAPPNPLRPLDRPAAPARPAYGPANNPSVMQRDSERVGTAPNGEPMYAAEWYRHPADDMMRSYLSTAHGPGWALIACRTAPEFRVEDCAGLDEYPEGSQILRSVLAMAWEFRVRPPRRGGQVLVGSWVRIRIDYH
jgi:protein TonB